MLRVRPVHVLALAAVPLAGALAFAAGAAAQTPPAGIEITGDDNGRSFNAVVGQQVTVRLGSGLSWSVSYEPPGILVAVPGVNALAQGVQGILRAAQPGTVTVVGSGRPICKPGEICPQFVTRFTATIVVAPAGTSQQPAGSARTQQPTAPTTPGRVTPPTTPPVIRSSPPAGVRLPDTGRRAAGSPTAPLSRLLLGAGLLLGLAGIALTGRRSS